MKKKILFWLLFIACLSGLLLGLLYEVTLWAPRRITVTYDEITSAKLPASFDNSTVLFITDIHYNAFMNKQRLQPVIDRINQLGPDIVIFGGDLFDHPSVVVPTIAIQEEITFLLESIQAPLGKYAVLGNHDLESSRTRQIVETILHTAGFYVLVNELTLVYNQNSTPIQLIGLDSQLLGNPDIPLAFENHQADLFTLVISHTPDIADELPYGKVDWQLSGHSHGGQIALPFLKPILTPPFAQNYRQGTYQVQDFRLDVSNGVGTTRYDMRLFANPQLNFFRFITP